MVIRFLLHKGTLFAFAIKDLQLSVRTRSLRSTNGI